MAGPRFPEPIVHVDMDAFFVEVERREDPGLRAVPVVVGGLGTRGVVAAASYEAREHGVHSAMSISRARRLCPHARFLPPDHRRYRDVSEQVFAVFRSFTPVVEGLSVDEAFLDIAGLRLHFPDAEAVGADIRRVLRAELQLPASVGIAPNKFLAKLASAEAKPDGLLRVPAGRERAFLHPLPVRRMWGVGEATYATLEGLGVRNIGDLAAVPQPTLVRRVGSALGTHLHALANGVDERRVEPDAETKSVSVEHTFDTDISGLEVAAGELLRLCDRLTARLRRAGLAGRTVTLKVRRPDFTTFTRTLSLAAPVDVTRDLYVSVQTLMERIDLSQPVRLLGVAVSGLEPSENPRQLNLDRSPAWDDVASAVEAVRARFGASAVEPARLAEPPVSSRRERPDGATEF